MRHLIVALVLSLSCGRASADQSNESARAAARDHFAKGTSYFDLGRYDEAIAEYELAYEAKNEPTLLYNIAQAHRLANHSALALRFYKMFLTRLPDAPNRGEVEAKIAALERIVEQQRTSPTPPAEQSVAQPRRATKTPADATSTTPPATSTAMVSPARNDVASSAHAGRPKRVAGIVIAAAGLAIIGGGIAAGVLAKNASDTLSADNRNHTPYDEATYNTGKTDQILEGVLLGVGSAALVTGGVLLLIGQHEGNRARVATVAPMLSPTSAGLAMHGSF